MTQNQPQKTTNFRPTFTIALLSASGILLEIALTRLLSALYYPQTIFVVLSLAVLGIGIGAGLATTSGRLRSIERLPSYIALAGLSALVLTVISILTATSGDMVVTGLVMLAPYSLIGLSFATLFSDQSDNSRTLYAADLMGAGVATILIIPLLNALGAINGLLLIVVLFMLTALVYRPQILGVLGGVLAVAVLITNVSASWLNVDMGTLGAEKPITQTLVDGGEILETRWDSFARTDLVQPAEGSLRIYVDGAAASIIPPVEDNEHLIGDIGLFAFVTAQPQSVFTIGSGGGLDVWFARQTEATDITAVEVNPQSVQLVEDYADYSGDLYNQPAVTVAVDEGRSVLRRSDKLYDLIFLSQVVTLTSERAGYAMTENSVFTLEAFSEYLSHLTPDGYLSIKLYDEITMSRALSLAISALKQDQNLSDIQALDHIVAMLDPSTSPPTPLLMIKKSAFTEDEVVGIGRISQRIGFATLFLPGIQADPPLDAVVNEVNTFDDVIDISPADLSAPIDDRPFFYQFDRGLPDELETLVIILAIVLTIVLILLIIYYAIVRVPKLPSNVVYFSALGSGFMLVEIALIQQTRLLIGHPTLAVALVIAVLLIGGGLGSMVYRYLVPDLTQLSIKPLLLIIALVAVWQFMWSAVSAQVIGADPIIRIGAVIVMILPLGLAMGIPFPAGLTVAGQTDKRLVTLAWGMNGIFSVVGSVLAIVVAISVGFSMVFWVAVAFYTVATLAILFVNRS